ncbi:unnamed protein product [Cyclocybe aegerita]|uniref:Uncharacterized protein n=1 Tax=Cyclocybe aegerita TaxID=1973307 RepID=A0A8S0XFR7_CYCAE|nr:unnamed protein product [Cyclocybe aegerita]
MTPCSSFIPPRTAGDFGYISSDVDVGGSDSNDSDGSDDDHEQLSEFVIYEIYPADDHAKLERIAELQNHSRHSSFSPIAPLFSISFPDTDLLGFGSYCEGPCDWYSGLAQPLLFDIVDTSFPDTIARYKILLDDDLTKVELVRLSTTYFPLGDGVFEPYRFCEGTLVAWWSNNRDRVRGIRTSSSTPGEATDPTFVSKTYTLCPTDQQMIADSSFCPISLPVLKLRSLVPRLLDVETASLSVPP